MHINKFIRAIFITVFLFLFVDLNAGGGLCIPEDTSGIIPYQIKYYSSLDGLTQVSINTLLRDKQGFLWAGTQNGLNRFDGKDFMQFRYNPDDSLGLQGNYIVTLFQDSQDRIWIGTMNRGLSYYEPSSGIIHRIKTKKRYRNIVDQSNITNICEDENGIIWVNSLNFGVIMIKENEKGFFDIKLIKSFDKKEQSTSLFISKDQNLYITTNTGRIFVSSIIKDGSNKFEELSSGLVQGSIKSIYVNDRFIWVGTDYGLWQIGLKNLKSVFYDLNTALSLKTCNYMVLSIVPNIDKMWIGTANGAYLLSDRDKYGWYHKSTLFSESGTKTGIISNNSVYSILPDSNNLVWIGTAKDLNLLDFNVPKFKTIKNKKGKELNNQVVFSIFKNEIGLWVGTSGGGLNLFQNGKVYYFTEKNGAKSGIASNVVRSISEDNNGYLWIGTIKGVSVINLRTFNPEIPEFATFHTDPVNASSLSDDFVKYIYQDNNGNIWIATYGKGLNRFIGNLEKKDYSFQHFLHSNSDKNSISSNYVNYITQDQDDTYWIATQEGLNKLTFEGEDYKSPGFIVYKYDNLNRTGISESSVLDISVDQSGILWIGTRYGFNRFDPESEVFESYFRKDGLANNLIFSVQNDNLGQIWLGTGRGLSCFNKAKKKFTNYYLKDGLQDNEFNSLARFKDDEGNIYMGGIGGLTVFEPSDLKIQENSYEIELTGLSSKNKNFNRVSDYGRIKLKKELSMIKELNLKYNDFPLFIKFASPKANPLHLPNYFYKLTPLDKGWIDLKDRNEIQLLNLSPGKYSLYLTGGNFGKIWNRSPKKIDILVSPPWWSSIWAYLLYVLLLAGVSYMIFRLIYKRKLAFAESKKWQHIEEMKSEFYTNITHEFRSPLTVILGMTEQISSSLGIQCKKPCVMPLKAIKRNGRKLLNLVNQLLDMAKIEDGKYQINNTKGDIVWFLGFMVENFYSYAQSKNIKLIYYTEFDKLIMDFDSKVMERIMSNLLGNAIKFSDNGGKVIIHVNKIKKADNSMLQVKIKDEGIGIEKSAIPYIFDRYYQIDASRKNRNEGTGIGLSMVKNLIELMKGSISVKSKIGNGSTFTFVLPITKAAAISSGQFEQKSPLFETDDNIVIESYSDDKDIVLIVEDNKDIAKYISSSISDKYSVRYAGNGESGLQLAINIIPDLIISDVMMPKMDGFEMCENLKRNIKTSHIPVILLTARITEEDKLKGLTFGADAYLTKPFNTEELNIRIEQLILLRKKLQDKYKNPDNWNKYEKSKTNSIDHEFLIKVKEKINANIDNTYMNSQFLAKSMRMSDTQLYRKLKALTGKSTAIFIRTVRLKKAKELLETTALNISEIAYDTGFNDPAYFSRVFKEEYGITPGEVR